MVLHRVQPPPQFHSPGLRGVVGVIVWHDEVEGHVEVAVHLLVGHDGSCQTVMIMVCSYGETEKIRVKQLELMVKTSG